MMDQPIESVLLSLLTGPAPREYVTLEDLCWWDTGRAQAVTKAAGMVPMSQYGVPIYTWGETTADWLQTVFEEVRNAAPSIAAATAACACHAAEDIDTFDTFDRFDTTPPEASPPPADRQDPQALAIRPIVMDPPQHHQREVG